MSPRTQRGPRRARRGPRAILAAAGAALAAAAVLAPTATPVSSAAADSSSTPSGVTFQPQIGLPATGVVAFGASPDAQGVSGEAWAYGQLGDVGATTVSGGQTTAGAYVLLQRSDANGWQPVSLPAGSDGGDALKLTGGAQAGRATPDGGVALLARNTNDQTLADLVTINPGSANPQLAPQVPTGLLNSAESLPVPSSSNTVPFAAFDDGTTTSALIAPSGDTAGPLGYGVLDYNGASWSREQIRVPNSETSFVPLALACGPAAGASSTATDSGTNCWLLASGQVSGAPVLQLYGRESTGAAEVWVQQSMSSGLFGQTSGATESALPAGAQMLTVTSQGVWIDFQAQVSGGTVSASELVIPGTVAGAGTSGVSLGAGSPVSTWCSPQLSTSCTASLGASLADLGGGYLSFAWPGTSASDPGTRIVTGLGEGAVLELTSGASAFTEQAGAGGDLAAGEGDGDELTGAAFASLTQGWITTATTAGLGQAGADDEGEPQVIDVTQSPATDALTSDPVPFGSPLLAATSAPGSTPGDPNAEAIAVGVNGETAHYTPSTGWTPQALLNGAGAVQTPTLRGVAWPEAGRAYAVGDNGAMWVWQSSTDQWEPDPAKPYNFQGNLTAIAFDPGNPDLGYAVGKDGVMLQFGKTWTQMTLPSSLQSVDFTSVTFAGGVALATYRTVLPVGTFSKIFAAESGGLAIDTGAGWEPDTNANQLLGLLPEPTDAVLSKVAGLADGGAVAAGPGIVIETNDAAGDDWTISPEPLPEAQNVSALAAYRQANGSIGAFVSIDLNPALDPNGPSGGVSPAYAGDVPYNAGGSDQPSAYIGADPLPDTGYLLEQTSSGWLDVEHATDAQPAVNSSSQDGDVSVRPDPVLGLLVSPTGTEGLAVGGQTGNSSGTSTTSSDQTGGIMRFGAGAGTGAQAGTVTVSTDPTQASFVLAGNDTCAATCAWLAGDGIGPDTSLTNALTEASSVSGVRAFLDAGGRIPAALSGDDALGAELGREASLLGGASSSLPVEIAPAETDADSAASFQPFAQELGPFTNGATASQPYYTFTSQGSSGNVMVVVLAFSAGNLVGGQTQLSWLTRELGIARNAGEPAIVVGSDALQFTLPHTYGTTPTEASSATAAAVDAALVSGGASAYLFDYPQANVQTTVRSGAGSIPAFGSGTLGYVTPAGASQTDSLGSSAMLIISVKTTARNPQTNVAPVTAVALPNIGQLAIDATDGTLLRRSQVALFTGLARRPLGGTEWQYNTDTDTGSFLGPAPYDAIPNDCSGSNCTYEIPEQYNFTSSDPSIGNFVEHDSASSNPLAVAVSSSNTPIPDSSSGLFCAFNSGTTTVTLTAGGLTYSMPVTVQAGSVEAPCGTVPSNAVKATAASAGVSVNPIVTKQPHISKGPKPVKTVIPPSVPVTKVTPAPVTHHVTVPTPAPVHHPLPVVPAPQPSTPFIHATGQPPPPPAPRPVPPSGSSQVPSNSSVAENIPAAQKEREKLAATQGVDAMVARDPDGPLPIPAWSIGLIVLAAAASGTGLRRRGRGGGELAWSTARAGSQARARTWHRPPPGGGR